MRRLLCAATAAMLLMLGLSGSPAQAAGSVQLYNTGVSGVGTCAAAPTFDSTPGTADCSSGYSMLAVSSTTTTATTQAVYVGANYRLQLSRASDGYRYSWHTGPTWVPLGQSVSATYNVKTERLNRAPSADLPGWQHIMAENFDGSTKPASWAPYSDTLCCGDQYDDGANTSYSNSQMVVHVRNYNGTMQGTAGRFGTPDLVGMRTAFRFKIDAPFSGSGFANMIWPADDVWGNGEIDWPEVQFDSTIEGFIHELGANPANNALYVDTHIAPTAWHTAVTEWVPGQRTTLFLDGAKVGENTTHVPTTPHDWRWQAGDNGGTDSSGGTVRIDWVSQWKMSAAAPAIKPSPTPTR